MIKTVLSAMNGGFLQTLKLFAVTLAGALPLGLLLSFCTMSRFKPLRWLTRTLVWIVRGTPLMLQLLILYYVPGVLLGASPWMPGEPGRFLASMPFISRKFSAPASRAGQRASRRPRRCSA